MTRLNRPQNSDVQGRSFTFQWEAQNAFIVLGDVLWEWTVSFIIAELGNSATIRGTPLKRAGSLSPNMHFRTRVSALAA